MAINSVNNGAVSWAQFVTAAQAARQRNAALSANAGGGGANNNSGIANTNSALPTQKPAATIAPKIANNVYSTYGRINAQPIQSAPVNTRPVGSMFDSYA